MKLTILLTIACGFSATASAQYTGGYMRKNGTYVQGYNHTPPDGYKYNNYSAHHDPMPIIAPARTDDSALLNAIAHPTNVQVRNPMDYAIQAQQLRQLQLQNQAMEMNEQDRQAREIAEMQNDQREIDAMRAETERLKKESAELEKHSCWWGPCP